MKKFTLSLGISAMLPFTASAAAKSFASGQVIHLVSSTQNGRSVAYRAMLVRAGTEPERNLQAVIEKVQRKVDRSGKATNLVREQLIIPTAYLPYAEKAAATMPVPLSNSDLDGESSFLFQLSTGTCNYTFDGTGTGTSLTLDHWKCVIGE